MEAEFLTRWHEVRSIYNGLYYRQNQIREEISVLNREIKNESDEMVTELLSGTSQNQQIKSRIRDLEDESAAIAEKIRFINSKGGMEYLLKSDSKLKELAEEFAGDLRKQAKADEKKRLDLEKRYQKVLSELWLLDQERVEFIKLYDQRRELASRLTRVKPDFQYKSFSDRYEFEKVEVYRHLGQIRDKYRFKNVLK